MKAASLWLIAAMALGCSSGKPKNQSDTRRAMTDPNGEQAPRWEGADTSATAAGSASPGVRPTPARLVERHQSAAPAEMPTATLPGFRMLNNGRSRVFLEVSGDVPMTEAHAPGKLRYRFQGVRVPERVNRMPLPTMHFPTPVARVQLNQVDADAELVIELRAPVEPQVRVERASGSMVISADFPRPKDASDAAAKPTAATQGS